MVADMVVDNWNSRAILPFRPTRRIAPDGGARPLFHHSGIVLLAGFGGLLLLMAYAGWNTLRVLGQTEQRSARIQEDFVTRSRLLTQIRSDLYLSGTYVRDTLLEPDPLKANAYRTDLDEVRRRMGADVDAYSHLPELNEADPLNRLRRQLADYWRVLAPVMTWKPEERRRAGYNFLQDEVFPRRASMLTLADEIASVNQEQLRENGQRVSALFRQVRTGMIATLAVTLLAGALLAIFSMSRVLKVEREAAVRYAETAQARRELQELSARLLDVQETERRAISRELHDEVGQSMSALLVGLGNLSAAMPGDAKAVLAAQIHGLREIAENSVRAVRNLSLLLRPSMLDDLGLVPALRWQARETTRITGVRVDVAADDTWDDLPDEYKTCVYRVVQEGLQNAARHANAQRVRVQVMRKNGDLLLTIHDDGCGFDVTDRGMGLLGIQERVANLGGTFKVESEAKRGTLLAASLPLAEQYHDPDPIS